MRLNDPLLGRYKLDGHEPVPEPNLIVWLLWFEVATESGERIVAQTAIDEHLEVSTVFLGIDHRHGEAGPPLLFETAIFEHGSLVRLFRYSTWAEAEIGHEATVRAALEYSPETPDA